MTEGYITGRVTGATITDRIAQRATFPAPGGKSLTRSAIRRAGLVSAPGTRMNPTGMNLRPNRGIDRRCYATTPDGVTTVFKAPK